jgi:acetolactate synthase I/II/III large subunit
MLDLSQPDIDFSAPAAGVGVSASLATTAAELANQLRNALAESGPHLIKIVIRRWGNAM